MKKLLLVLFLMFVLAFSVNAAGNLSMFVTSVSPSSLYPGNSLTLTLNLTNSGNNSINRIRISTTDPTGANGSVLDVSDVVTDDVLKGAPLDAKTSATATVNIIIPAGQPGSYSATLKSEDTNNNANTDSKNYNFNLLSPLNVKFNNADISNPLTIDLESGEDDNQLILTLTNLGLTQLNNIRTTAVFADLEDNDDDEVNVLNPLPISALLPGQSATVTFTFDVDSGFDESTLSGILRVEANEIIRPTDYGLKLNVKPIACQPNAKQNDIGLDINNPDDDDEFEPGDTVNVELDIDNKANNDIDFKIEAILYDTDNDKRIDTNVIKKNVDNDESETVKFKMNLVDNKNEDVKLYIKVYDDDDDLRCKLDDVDLDIEVPDHKITINNPSLVPLTATCGDRVTGSASLKNVGDNDENIVFDFFSTQLGISQSSQSFTLNEDDDENERLVNFAFTVPQNIKDGSYPISLRAKYSGRETAAQTTLNVNNCGNVVLQPVQKLPTQQSDQSTVTLGSTVYTEKSLFDAFNKKDLGVPTSAWILLDVLLVLLIIGSLVWLFRPR